MKIFITGAAGFIGSNFVHYMINKYPDIDILIYDKFTYAGNINNLKGAAYTLYTEDVCDYQAFSLALEKFQPDFVVHLAAESHVDRSLLSPQEFLETNILGTEVVLRAVKNANHKIKKLVHISTDEVYGSLKVGEADEQHPFKTNSPYSASKAAGDLMCRAYYISYGIPVSIIRGSNCYGPRQFPEKYIPRSLTNLFSGKDLCLYGDGNNFREWTYTEDFCSGIETVMLKGQLGEAYNLGSGEKNRISNKKIAHNILGHLGFGFDESRIKYVKDRLGHDFRYSLNSSKLAKLGWSPKYDIETGLASTVKWYEENQWWWEPLL